MKPTEVPPPLPLHVDRDLPVSLHAQLVGQIEYGIATGRLAAESRLPSVRELADQLSLSPVTVSNVFKALRERELIETVPGRGTFVARRDGDATPNLRLPAIHRAIDELVRLSERSGMTRDELAALFAIRLRSEDRHTRVNVYLVGVFDEATARYGRTLAERLGPSCQVSTTTFERLHGDTLENVSRADLALTFAYRRRELQTRLAGRGPRVTSLRFLPQSSVRSALATLSPFSRVGVVSALPSFLPTFLDGVRSYAGHVADVRGTVLDAPDVDALVATSDVIIYSTGADAVLERLPPDLYAFEYRHDPDPVWIEENIVPEVHAATSAAPTPPKEATCTSTT